MRIAFAHYNEAEDISGVTSWLIRLALDLRQRGCGVAIHLLDHCTPLQISPLEAALQGSGIFLSKSVPTGSLRRDVQHTLAFLNRWQPDVFLPQCKTPHFVAAAIAGRRGLPWGFTLHSDDPDYWAVTESLPPKRHGGRTIAVSCHIQAALAARSEEAAAAVIPCGVAIPSRTTRPSPDHFEVVYSGRLWEYQKRASLVTESLILACRHGAGRIRATLIGDGYSREACEGMVQAAGLSERILFAGRQSAEGVQAILQRSQAILLMSDFEGLPVALLEAMAAGVVPVVRAIPSGIPELVHNNKTGLLVSEDPEDAAAALIRLAGDPQLWQRCSAAGRRLVQDHYSEPICHRKWLELLGMMAAASAPHYPIRGWQGVRLSRLSAQMRAPYRKDSCWRSPALRKQLGTAVAKGKASIRLILQQSLGALTKRY